MSQSTKTKTQQQNLVNQNKNINLPKLDRIIIKNNGNYKSPNYYQQPYQEKKQSSIDNILKIEGKNNMKPYDQKKPIEKDLKA